MQNTHKLSQHPLVVWLFFFLAIVGIGQLVSGAKPGTVQETLSPAMQTLWSAMLGFGSLLVFVGIVWKWSVRWALEMESIGLLAVAGGVATYAVIVVLAAGVSAVLTAILCVTLAAACLMRRRQIERVLTEKARRHRKKERAWRRQQK
jgi:hypothetical protein